MVGYGTDNPDREDHFREESAEVVRELLAHGLIPDDREEAVRGLLDDGKPKVALHFGLAEDEE
jgi:hypothetical protein